MVISSDGGRKGGETETWKLGLKKNGENNERRSTNQGRGGTAQGKCRVSKVFDAC